MNPIYLARHNWKMVAMEAYSALPPDIYEQVLLLSCLPDEVIFVGKNRDQIRLCFEESPDNTQTFILVSSGSQDMDAFALGFDLAEEFKQSVTSRLLGETIEVATVVVEHAADAQPLSPHPH